MSYHHHTERRCVRSMDKGESEERSGRDGEIRTRDLLTPSQMSSAV